MKKYLNEIQSALMTGVSYMLPFVLSGGILIGLSYIIGGVDVGSLDSYSTIANGIWNVGQMAFGLMCPALGAYIAFALGDRGAIAAGLVGGLYAREMGAGFLGAMIAGIIAGYLVRMLKNLPVPGAIRGALATVIVPVISVLCVGFIMVYILGNPLAALSEWLTQWLESISTGNAILIGLITGAMYAFDMGGPVNKAAYAFGLACLEAGNWVPICAAFVACISPQLSVLIEIDNYPRADKAVITYTRDGSHEVISMGETGNALLYEIEDMEKSIMCDKDNTYLNYSRDVTSLLTEIRQQWGFQYPFE